MNKQSQSGFAVIELAIVVVVLAVLGGTSYFVWHQHHDKNKLMPTASTTVAPPSGDKSSDTTSTPSAPQVNNASDLNSAMQALNQTDLAANNNDSGQLSTQANGF